MDWGTVIAAFVGAAIPSSGTLLTLRSELRRHAQDRRWLDADVVADVRQLLEDIEPLNLLTLVNFDGGAAAKLWDGFDGRRTRLRRDLRRMSTGHPDRRVKLAAGVLVAELGLATDFAKLAASDEFQVCDDPQWMKNLKRAWRAANSAQSQLDAAVQMAGRPGRLRRALAKLTWRPVRRWLRGRYAKKILAAAEQQELRQ